MAGATNKARYLVFLPGDNKDLSSPATQAVLSAINEDLGRLLQSPTAQFWDAVKNDPSLHACLDSFLRFKRRAPVSAARGASLEASTGISRTKQRYEGVGRLFLLPGAHDRSAKAKVVDVYMISSTSSTHTYASPAADGTHVQQRQPQ